MFLVVGKVLPSYVYGAIYVYDNITIMCINTYQYYLK